ncbi:hypothetical protein LTS17_009963 [Exophiala oligosperma]
MNMRQSNQDNSSDVEHVEIPSDKQDVSIHRDHVVPVNDSQLPKGYFYSSLFVGSYMAQAFGFMAAVGVFAMAAPNLGKINDDIGGANSNITWVAIVYTLMFGVGSALVGRLSDIFGRRWFFTSGAALGIIGSIVCSRAQTVPTLIGGMTLVGASASTQVLFATVIGELVPIKYRFLAGAGFYGLGATSTVFATKVGIVIADNEGWRWIFYLMIILNSLSTMCWYLFYRPPTFEMLHHGRETIRHLLLHFDYVGFTLFNGGFVLLMLGLSWGGQLYPWDGPRVICTLAIGGVSMIAFIVYEAVLTPKEPYIPLKLFRNIRYDAATTVVTVSAMSYYGFSIIWPTMSATLYPASKSAAGWKAAAGPGMFSLGSFLSLAVASYVRRLRYFLMVSMVLGATFCGAVAAGTQDNQALTIAMLALGCFFLGVVDSVALTLTSITVNDQNEIGTAVGIAAAIRCLGGSVASTTFSTILANRLKTTIPALVPPVLIKAGLPESSVASFISAMQGLIPFSRVSGLTPTILAAGTTAYQTASSQAYRTCFLTSLAFGGLGLIGSWFCADLNPEMERMVAKELHAKKDEKRLEQENRDLDT